MSCKITPDMSPAEKIDIMLGNEAMNRYRNDVYGMNTCKIGYDYMYLADLKFLLEMTSCIQTTCYCYCNCSNEQVTEKINTL